MFTTKISVKTRTTSRDLAHDQLQVALADAKRFVHKACVWTLEGPLVEYSQLGSDLPVWVDLTLLLDVPSVDDASRWADDFVDLLGMGGEEYGFRVCHSKVYHIDHN